MNNIELYVRDVLKNQSGDVIVVGIPNNGVSLKVGDGFKLRYEVDRDDVLNGIINPARQNCMPVDLVVERIDVMRKLVEQLPHGVTGGLYLAGHGIENVTPGCFLRT